MNHFQRLTPKVLSKRFGMRFVRQNWRFIYFNGDLSFHTDCEFSEARTVAENAFLSHRLYCLQWVYRT